ncbi:MAG: hypothetical protein VX246_01075 [Myxococcota bacterium]|nr:hypothetical protein [Myxococcota bacterium]
MTPDTGQDRQLQPGGSVALAIGALGVAASALVFGILAPLRGGIFNTALVTLLLLLVPGYLAVGLLQLQSRLHSLPSLLGACIALGAGLVVPFAGFALAQGWALGDAALGLAGVELIALLSWGGLERSKGFTDSASAFAGLRARRATEWLADATVFAAGIGLAALVVQSIEPNMRSGDLWYYLSYIDWMANEPGRNYVPHTGDLEELNVRLMSSGFLAFEAMITTLVHDGGSSLEVFWSWLPPTLIPLALIAMYSVACALGSGAATRIGLVAIQLVLVFATLGYLLDRDTSGVRWPGSVLFFRISQDKVFLGYILAPLAARFGIEWLRLGERRWLGAMFIAGAGCVVTHPLGLPFLAMLTLPYAVATAVLAPSNEPQRKRWLAVLAIALTMAPLALWPLSQRTEEGAPNTLADEAGFARREHLTRDSLSIRSRENNEFTAHSSLISHPLILGGIACGLGLGIASRRRADARYAFATMLAPLVMLYTPGIAPLAGKIVTPYLLWRFTWLLPTALSIAVGTTLVAALARSAMGVRMRAAGPIGAGVALAAFFAATSVPGDLQKSHETLESLLPAPFDSTTANRLIGGIRETVPSNEVVLLDPSLQVLAISLAPGMQTAYWRMGSNPDLYWRVIDLFEARLLASRHLELMREYRVQWIGVRKRTALINEVRRRTDIFTPAGNVASIFLFRVDNLSHAAASDDAIAYWRAQAAKAPNAATLTELALALIGEGENAEAMKLLTRAIQLDPAHAPAYETVGTLLLVGRDYGGAIEQLGRAIELDADLQTASNNLAWVLATCPAEEFRNAERALELASAAIDIGIDASTLDTLATAQAATGAFDDAIVSTRRALDIYESNGATRDHTEPLRQRLQLYADRRPYIEVED